ncbi:hypothetical protein TNCV_906661 [Trichonephila clavipes]|nr:hypothetical protein TNCV_906661 [Trichonephila clavipes]
MSGPRSITIQHYNSFNRKAALSPVGLCLGLRDSESQTFISYGIFYSTSLGNAVKQKTKHLKEVPLVIPPTSHQVPVSGSLIAPQHRCHCKQIHSRPFHQKVTITFQTHYLDTTIRHTHRAKLSRNVRRKSAATAFCSEVSTHSCLFFSWRFYKETSFVIQWDDAFRSDSGIITYRVVFLGKFMRREFSIGFWYLMVAKSVRKSVGPLVVREWPLAGKKKKIHAEIVEVEIGGVAIYRPFGESHRAKSYCHLYGAQGQRQAYF